MRSRGEKRVRQRVCLLVRCYGCAGWRPKGRRYAAYRPAGTREALPGTMRGTCVLRF